MAELKIWRIMVVIFTSLDPGWGSLLLLHKF